MKEIVITVLCKVASNEQAGELLDEIRDDVLESTGEPPVSLDWTTPQEVEDEPA